MKICSFFGHRDVFDDIDNQLVQHIEYAITALGITDFYVGENGAFDKKATQVMLPIRKKYPNIKLTQSLAYLPIKKDPYQTNTWYDDTVFLEGLETAPKRFAISKRNRLMVQHSEVIICYIRTDHGGAYTAVHYAEKQGKTILNCTETDVL